MIYLVIVLLSLFTALLAYRQYWAKRSLPKRHGALFDGQVMKAGDSYIAQREGLKASEKSIICFPGFLEDMRYFQSLYQDSDAQLILFNNAHYHNPFQEDGLQALDWPNNPYDVGTIEYDAFYLGLAVSRLAKGKQLLLHGHSRGGAVMLEAGRQYPHLFNNRQDIQLILEAPVLPQARTAGPQIHPRLLRFMLPLVLSILRKQDQKKLLKNPMMRPSNPHKTQYCQSLYHLPKRYDICVENVLSILAWQQKTDYQVYQNFEQIKIVVGERDSILSRSSMLASAQLGQDIHDGIEIIETRNSNHFITLEQPAIMKELHRVQASMNTADEIPGG